MADNSETFIPLHTLDDWEAFWADNAEAFDVSRSDAFALACNQSLLIGGGAAPLFRIGFVDEE